MSFQLTFGGGEAVIVKDKGIVNTVQGFVSDETVVSKNIMALPTTFIFQLYDYKQAPLISIVNIKVWIKVSGIWKESIIWIKVNEIWKQSTSFIKVSGIWK
jgi:hypothetical protein